MEKRGKCLIADTRLSKVDELDSLDAIQRQVHSGKHSLRSAYIITFKFTRVGKEERMKRGRYPWSVQR